MTERTLKKFVRRWLDAGMLKYNATRTRIENPANPEIRQEAIAQELLLRLAMEYGPLKVKNAKDYSGITRSDLWTKFERAELTCPKDLRPKPKGKASEE
jgi:hypothetical protein